MQLGSLQADSAFAGLGSLGGASASPLLDAQRGFAESLAAHTGVHSRTPEAAQANRPTTEEQARKAAQEMVALSFVQPMLAEMRESEDAAGLFAPSPAEKQFRAMQDRLLAQEIVEASRFPLVDEMARKLLREQGAATDAAQNTPEAGQS